MVKINRSIDDGDQRQCSSCLVWYPRTKEYFVLNKQCLHGLAGTCKSCHRAYLRTWKKGNTKYQEQRRQAYHSKDKVIEAKKQRLIWLSDPYRKRAQALHSSMRDRAKGLGIPFDAIYFTSSSIEALLRDQVSCPSCGKPFNLQKQWEGKPCDTAPSVDRFRPDLGYIQGNVHIICWRCNNLKRDASADELAAVVAWMRKVSGSL